MSRKLFLALAVAAMFAPGCFKEKRRASPPPAPESKPTLSKEGAGVPKGTGTQSAPVGATPAPTDAPAPSAGQ